MSAGGVFVANDGTQRDLTGSTIPTSRGDHMDAPHSATNSKTTLGLEDPSAKHQDGEKGSVPEYAADAFGDEAGAAVQYKTMEWWHCGILMIAENVSLGVLALPQAVAWLGLVPGLLLILILGIIAGYTGYIIGQFKQAFPQVASFADCGQLIAGPIGRELMAISSILVLIFIMGAHCTVVFAAVGLIISFLLDLPRTLKGISYLSVFFLIILILSACISIFIAVIITMIGVGIVKPDVGAVVAVNPNMAVVTGLTPVMNIVLAYSGHVGFFTFVAELREPRDYTKALVFMQTTAVTFYLVISSVIYYYAGPHVASPALGSASPVVRKVAFGIALPTIVVSGVVNGSIVCKYIYVRVWTGTDVIHQKSAKSIGSWIAICGTCWLISWVIAESVPNFNSLLALIGSVFGSWFSYGLPGGLWLYMNKDRWFSTRTKVALTVLNTGLFFLGAAMCALGLWNSGYELSNGAAGKPFSCASNWHASTD